MEKVILVLLCISLLLMLVHQVYMIISSIKTDKAFWKAIKEHDKCQREFEQLKNEIEKEPK